MQVIKFEHDEQASLQTWLDALLGDRLANQILDYLIPQSFEIAQGWTEDRVAALLFSEVGENYESYGLGVTTHLPEDFLSYCLGFIECLDGIDEESLSHMFTYVAWDSYKSKVVEFAQDSANELEESLDFTLSETIQQYIPEWLESIVRDAIAAYNSPIAISISPSNYTE